MPLRSRAQVSLEMMFILAIILAGVVLVSSVYYKSDTKTQIVYHVKITAIDACSYLSTGVVINDTPYSSLSSVVRMYNYSSLNCQVSGVRLVQDSGLINVTVYVDCLQPVNSTLLGEAIERYIATTLSDIRGFSLKGGVLYFRNYPVRIGVVVR